MILLVRDSKGVKFTETESKLGGLPGDIGTRNRKLSVNTVSVWKNAEL